MQPDAPDPPPAPPDTADLKRQYQRRMRARRLKVPLWVQAVFYLGNLLVLFFAPWGLALLNVYVFRTSEAPAAFASAALTNYISFKFWLKRVPIFLDHGLEFIDEEDA